MGVERERKRVREEINRERENERRWFFMGVESEEVVLHG